MARMRLVKPETFLDADLNALPHAVRWLFVGLWTLADREGRVRDDPRELRVRLLAYDSVTTEECDQMLARLAPDFVTRYDVDGRKYLQINNFTAHQHFHHKEPESTIPGPARVSPQSKPVLAPVSPRSDPTDTDTDTDTEYNHGVRARRAPTLCQSTKHLVVAGVVAVPSWLHAEFVRGLNEEGADAKLRAWYAELEAEVVRDKTKLPDVVKWLRQRFAAWVSHQDDPWKQLGTVTTCWKCGKPHLPQEACW